MKLEKNRRGLLECALTVFLSCWTLSVSASTVGGGSMTLNLNADALASAFDHDFDPARRSFYLEEYFGAAQAAGLTANELLTEHQVPGTGEISGIGRELRINGPAASGPNIATDFRFDAGNLAGTAAGAIGLGGAMRFRLDVPFTVNPDTGEEENNRIVTAYFSLEYDNRRVNPNAGHSGWVLVNQYGFRADVFELDRVVSLLGDDSLTLSGDLSLASGLNHLGGKQGTVVGNFVLQTAVVPLPAAVWLFAGASFTLFAGGVKRKRA